MATEKTMPESKGAQDKPQQPQQAQAPQKQAPQRTQPQGRSSLPVRRTRPAALAAHPAREAFMFNPLDFFADPFSAMRGLRDEMDRMLGGMDQLLERPGFGLQQGEVFSPQIDIRRTADAFVVRADLPGVKKDDVEVEVLDDALRVAGERRSESSEEREGYIHSERTYGRFERLIPLPEGCDTKSVQASFDNGVLEVTLKAPQDRPRGQRVEIQDKASKPGGAVH